MRLVARVVFVGSLFAASPALAGFGSSSWGMSPDAAAAEAAKAGEAISERGCPVPWGNEPNQILLRTKAKIDGVAVAHHYVFGAKNGLELVVTYAMGADSPRACESEKKRLIAAYGEPRAKDPAAGAGQFDFLWDVPGKPEVIGLQQGTSECTIMTAERSVAEGNGAKVNQSGLACFEPLALGDNRGHLDGSRTTCTSRTDQSYFSVRPFRVEQPTDLQIELDIDKPGKLVVGFADDRANLAEQATTAATKDSFLAHARVTLQPGCYLAGVMTDGAKTDAYYHVDIEPYAAWKENDDLRREEQLGEPGDQGPPTARFPAIVMSGAPYTADRVHVHATGTIALASGANLYGASVALGVEVTRHPRARAIVGATASIMMQPMGDVFATTNTMLPVGLWGGVRANLTKKLLGVARAGLLGYYITADADEKMLGAIDRSETGGGYLVGLDLEIGSFMAGAEWWLLGETVSTFHLGFGF